MARTTTSISEEDLSFIKDAEVLPVTEEEIRDITTLISKYHYKLEVLGEPLHLRLPEDCKLSSFKMEDVSDKVIKDPYNQYISKVQKGVYHFKRGPPPKRQQAARRGEVTVGELFKTGNRPDRLKNASLKTIEKEYWREIRRLTSTPSAKWLATYASDVLGTAMDFNSKQVTLNNLNTMLQKIVSKYSQPIPGISTSMLYIGVWLSTFTQHLEDKNFWSTSYLHGGAPKFWYVTPATYTDVFERRINEDLEGYMIRVMHHVCESIFRHKCTLIDPLWYKEKGIPLIRIVQMPGDLVILPPYTYHFGFNGGPNFSEATNFATKNWLPVGLLAKECHRMELETIDLEPFVAEIMPEWYRKYLDGGLRLVHPFDSKKQLQTVSPPVEVKVDEDIKDYMVKSRGLDYIYLAKIFEEKKFLFGVIGDLKTWMEKSEVDGMIWASTGEKVKLTEDMFTSCEKIHPFFHAGQDYSAQEKEVVIYPRTFFDESCGSYTENDIKFFNWHKSFEEGEAMVQNGNRCILEAQLVLIFVTADSNGLLQKGLEKLWGQGYVADKSLICIADEIFGKTRWTRNPVAQIPFMTGMIVPKLGDSNVKPFLIDRASCYQDFVRKLGLQDAKFLKAIIFIFNDQSMIKYLQKFLSLNPTVTAAGGCATFLSNNVAGGFLVFGENVSVGCCAVSNYEIKGNVDHQLRKLKVGHRGRGFAIIFSPSKLADRLDVFLQKRLRRDFPKTELIGMSTTYQLGWEESTETPVGLPNIIYTESPVMLIVSTQ